MALFTATHSIQSSMILKWKCSMHWKVTALLHHLACLWSSTTSAANGIRGIKRQLKASKVSSFAKRKSWGAPMLAVAGVDLPCVPAAEGMALINVGHRGSARLYTSPQAIQFYFITGSAQSNQLDWLIRNRPTIYYCSTRGEGHVQCMQRRQNNNIIHVQTSFKKIRKSRVNIQINFNCTIVFLASRCSK